MSNQVFAGVIVGLIITLVLWGFGVWKELNWSQFFRENYLLPIFLFACGIVGGYVNGAPIWLSMLMGLILAFLISFLFGVRFQSEYTLYKSQPSLNVHWFFTRSSNSSSEL